MRVADLQGEMLDFWVAKACQLTDSSIVEVKVDGDVARILLSAGHRGIGNIWFTFSPSTRWDYGGPIIDRENIGVCKNAEEAGGWCAAPGCLTTDEIIAGMQYGQTPLIAAMRCFVASKLGEEVEDTGNATRP